MNHHLAQSGIVNKAIPFLQQQGPENQYGFAYYIAALWQTMVILGGLGLLLYLVWGTVDWLMSEGEPQKLTAARNKILHSLIGFGLLVTSYAIIKFIIPIFGLNILQPTWPTPE